MRELLKIIMNTIFITLPLILIVITVYNFKNYRYAVLVTTENIEAFRILLFENNIDIELDENVKEIAKISSYAMGYSRYQIVYNNGGIEEFDLEKWKEDKKLSEYIIKNSNNKFTLQVWLLMLIVSIIISIYLINQTKK